MRFFCIIWFAPTVISFLTGPLSPLTISNLLLSPHPSTGFRHPAEVWRIPSSFDICAVDWGGLPEFRRHVAEILSKHVGDPSVKICGFRVQGEREARGLRQESTKNLTLTTFSNFYITQQNPETSRFMHFLFLW